MIRFPLARVWDRHSKAWSHKLLDIEEINSINSTLTGLDLVTLVNQETRFSMEI